MAAESALDLVARGYTAVKFDPAGPYTIRGGHQPALSDIATSVAFCAAIREAVGEKADLLFGTHGQFTTAGAIRLGQAIENPTGRSGTRNRSRPTICWNLPRSPAPCAFPSPPANA